MSLATVDYVFIGIGAAICIFSFFTGFLKRLSGLIAAITAFFITQMMLESLEINKLFTNHLHKTLITVLLFLVIFIAVKLVVKKIAKDLSDKPIAGSVDKTLGFLCGLVISVTLLTIASLVIYFVKPAFAEQSVIIQAVINIIQL